MLVGPWSSSQFVEVARPDGYAIEAFITATDLGLLAWLLDTGAHVGIDLAVDFGATMGNPSCRNSVGQATLRETTPDSRCDSGEPACMDLAFCAPQLTAP
jgi:hypothetical protein